MRYCDLLAEKIVSRPRDLRAYLRLRINIIDRVMPLVAHAREVIHSTDRDGDYLVRYAIRQLNDNYQLPSEYACDLTRAYELESLRHNLEAIASYGPGQFAAYALKTFEFMRPVSADVRAVLALMADVDGPLQEYGFVPGERETDPEYLSARRLADAYLAIGRALAQIEPMLAELKAMLLDQQKRLMHSHNAGAYRPDHAEVETLYHASMYASEIARDGFAAEKPAERSGVGNLGSQRGISFTHDIRIAHDIMRALRDMCMIVHGELSRRDILKWLAAEHIDATQAGSYFMTSDRDVNSPEQVIGLYRGYLGLSKLRADPVFVSPETLIDQLRHRTVKDIGIVAAPVKLNRDEDYLHGEAEFRVPASNVVGPIKRII